MAPRISVCRKSKAIFLSIEGDFSSESCQELLTVMRQLLVMSLKCTAPGCRVAYKFHIQGKVDLNKMVQFLKEIKDQSCDMDVCGIVPEKQGQEIVPFPMEVSPQQARKGLVLIKGGVS